MTRPIVLFCCDASATAGAGHLTRCLALAETFADADWRVIFAVGPQALSTVPVLGTAGFTVRVLDEEAISAPRALGELAEGEAEVLVVDHYGRDAGFEAACRDWANRIVVMDDGTGRRHDCDVLVDAAASDPASYTAHVPDHARLLLGPAFAPVRRAFVAQRQDALVRRNGSSGRRIFLSFGATDPMNMTAMALDALARLDGGADITIALSSAAPHLADIKRRLGPRVTLALDPPDMALLMSRSDLSIGAAGVTAYERAVLGLPTILVVSAANQKGVCRSLSAAGGAIDGGSVDAEFPDRLRLLTAGLLGDDAARTRMASAAASLVDGRGAERVFVAAERTTTRTGVQLALRLVEAEDERWMLELQREPGTRQFARNRAAPSCEEHHRWMTAMLASKGSMLAVIEANGMPVGTVRLDRRDDAETARRYEVSIAISSCCHGQGIGSAALALVRRLQPGAVLDAEVFPENVASRRLFARAGYAHVRGNLHRSLPA